MAGIKLANNIKEEALYESLADIFVMIKSVERLERAYVRDLIPAESYEPACHRLLAQFKTLWNSMRDAVQSCRQEYLKKGSVQVPDIDQFIARHSMHCPLAAARLKAGVPATIEHGKADDASDSHVAVASAVSSFITTMDAIRLGMVAVDEILPTMKDLLLSLNKLTKLPAECTATSTVQTWYSKLHMKHATYEMPEEDKRQLLYDLESAYQELINELGKK